MYCCCIFLLIRWNHYHQLFLKHQFLRLLWGLHTVQKLLLVLYFLCFKKNHPYALLLPLRKYILTLHLVHPVGKVSKYGFSSILPTMFNFRRSEKKEKDDDDERGINQMVQFLNKAYFLPLSSISTSSKMVQYILLSQDHIINDIHTLFIVKLNAVFVQLLLRSQFCVLWEGELLF